MATSNDSNMNTPPAVFKNSHLADALYVVFDTMVKLRLHYSSDQNERPTGLRLVGSLISMAGSEDYLLQLLTTEKLACRMAGAMLGYAHADWNDMASDAFGKVSNMTARLVKPKLPDGDKISLGLPMVLNGEDWQMRTPNMQRLATCAFRCEGEPFVATLGGKVQPRAPST
jgi:CheY-specific phosphatase CheX